MDHRTGYWLHVSEACSLTVYGLPPGTTQIQLRAGWNLLGYPATDDGSYTAAGLMADVGATDVELFAPAEEYLVGDMPAEATFKRGHAYWVYLPQDAVWTVSW
jgi:hypothetical protein